MTDIAKAFESNHYIEAPVLAILYSLSFKENSIKLCSNDFKGNFDDIESFYNFYLKIYGIHAEWVNDRIPYIGLMGEEKFHKKSVTFSLPEEFKEEIQEKLKDYLIKYKKGTIRAYYDKNLDSYDFLKKKFKEEIDKTKNLKNYNITANKNSLIVMLYENIISNNITINSIDIEMQSDDTSKYIDEIVHIDNTTDITYLNYEFVNIKLNLNLNKFIHKRRNHDDSINFTEREYKVIEYTKNYINRGYIEQKILIRRFSPNPHETKSLTDFIYRLNKKTKQKYGKHLLKMDRATNSYKINIIPELFNQNRFD